MANTQDAVVLNLASPPSGAGGTGPADGGPDFPSPTKHERNGLTGTELGTQTKDHASYEQRLSPPPPA